MMPHDQSGVILPFDQICEMVASADYDGMAIDLGAGDVEQAHAVRPHMERCGLTPLIVAFPKTIDSLHDTLLMAKDFGAPFVMYMDIATDSKRAFERFAARQRGQHLRKAIQPKFSRQFR